MAENPWAEDRSEQDPPKKRDAERLWVVLEKTLAQSTIEQRRARRWGIFFKSITLIYVIGLSLTVINKSELPMDALGSSEHTAVVLVDGVIASSEAANAIRVCKTSELQRRGWEGGGFGGFIKRNEDKTYCDAWCERASCL